MTRFFFCNANLQNLSTVKLILNIYESCSGQQVNLSKSSIFFSPNCCENIRNLAFDYLHIPKQNKFGKYLGLESDFGLSKKKIFENLKNKVKTKISSWSNHFLNHAGRETLIKAVLEALPTYTMSCFFIPTNVLEDIIKDIRDFFWNNQTHWSKWESICTPSEEGGLGFKNLRLFNEAMLAKTSWRLLSDNTSILGKIYKSKYFNNSNILKASLSNRASWGWSSIIKGRNLLTNGIRWNVGNGESINPFLDPWIPKSGNFKPFCIHQSLPITVKDLMLSNSNSWDIPKLNSYFHLDDVNIIKDIPISSNNRPDILVWHYTAKGNYTVKSGYNLALQLHKALKCNASTSNPPNRTDLTSTSWKSIWKLKAQRKIRSFLWRALNNGLATKDNLFKRKISDSPNCPVCDHHTESINHCLFECHHAKIAWFASNLQLDTSSLSNSTFTNSWNTLVNKYKDLDDSEIVLSKTAYLIWSIWKARNKFTFEGIDPNPTTTVDLATSLTHEYRTHWDSDLQVPIKKSRWIPPPRTHLKLNTDATWNPQSSMGNTGWILRDHKNSFLAGGTSKEKFFPSPLAAEAYALHHGLQQASNISHNLLIAESDSLLLINAIHGDNPPTGEIYHYVEDIHTLSSNWVHVVFIHAPRACNTTAHCIAASGKGAPDDHNWFDRAPPWLTTTIILDSCVPINHLSNE
jgi:ribonuclease HI